MPGSDSLGSTDSSGSGTQQVMGPTSGISGMNTRSQSRGRADGAENRTPLSGRGLGGASSIWTAAAAAASNTSPSSGGPTEAMVALQQQMEQNQEIDAELRRNLNSLGKKIDHVIELLKQTEKKAVNKD